MNIILLYEELLSNQKEPSSKTTVKNYLSDLRQFVKWYEKKYFTDFKIQKIDEKVIKQFISTSSNSKSTQKRRIASLKKLFDLLETQGFSHNPTKQLLEKKTEQNSDEWRINEFKSYLFEQRAKKNTIINYESDIQAFKKWAENVLNTKHRVFSKITLSHIEEYKDRHKYILNSSPSTLKRKLASIKKYYQFLHEKGHLVQKVHTPRLKDETLSISEIENHRQKDQSFSPQYAPLRVLKTVFKPYIFIEEKIADSIVKVINN